MIIMTSQKKIITTNRKARHLYFVVETVEAGIVLRGTEVKSIRCGGGSVVDSYASVDKGEMYLYSFNIPPYEKGNRYNVDPVRARKLLLNKREINKLGGQVTQKGFTLIPLSVYFNERGKVKVELGLCKGKKAYDKRDAIRERDEKRIQERDFKKR